MVKTVACVNYMIIFHIGGKAKGLWSQRIVVKTLVTSIIPYDKLEVSPPIVFNILQLKICYDKSTYNYILSQLIIVFNSPPIVGHCE